MRTNHLKHIKEFEKSLPSSKTYVEAEYLVPDGKAQIDIVLPDEVFNPLSMGKQRELSSDIYDYIDSKLYTIPVRYPVRLCLHGKLPDAEAQAEIRKALKEHYVLQLEDKKLDLKINRVKALILTLIGVVFLAAYFAMELTDMKPVFKEFLSIVGSFAIWEAVDSWLLERKSLSAQRWSAVQSAMSEISFLPQ